MKPIKAFYPLIGPDIQAENWVVTLKDRPDLLFATNERDLISATPNPILYYDQIPLKWGQEYPGFFVFLRQAVEAKLPEWIIPPKTSQDQKPPYYTFESTRKPEIIQKVLILHHHDPGPMDWASYSSRYPGSDIRWISYSSIPPKWPLEKKMDFRLFCYHPSWRCDLLIDTNFGQGDTFSPVHLHALAGGAKFELTSSFYEVNKPRYTRETWYGTWKVL